MKRLLVVCSILIASMFGTYAGADNLYVSSEKDNRIIIFEANSLEKTGFIETAERPRSIIFSEDKTQIFVATGDSDVIEIVDIERGEVVSELEVGDDPEMSVLSVDGDFLYTSLEEDGVLSVFDLRDHSVRFIDVGEEPEGVLAHPNGSLVYVTSEEANLVQVVDVETGAVKTSITVGNRPRRFAYNEKSKELWVTNEMSGSVSVIDTETNSVRETLVFLPKGFRKPDVTPVDIWFPKAFRKPDVTPVDILFDVADDRAYVTLGRANHVAVVKLSTKEIEAYVLVGNRAWGITLDKKRSRVLVANGLSDDMSVIDTSSLKVIKTVPVARVPHTILIGD